jgi:glycosyltransferase involved in cell wall biosynthesis
MHVIDDTASSGLVSARTESVGADDSHPVPTTPSHDRIAPASRSHPGPTTIHLPDQQGRQDAVLPGDRLRTCAIIPAYNEEGSISSVVVAVETSLPDAHILVVDDGSRDNTAERARRAGATVLSLPVNLGIGGAVQTGFRYALRYGFDMALQIDGDGQHDPAEAERILGPIRSGEADMVVGSRWRGRGDYVAPTSRRFGMRILAALVRRKTGGTFTDSTSGFRAVGRRGIELFARQYPTDFPEVETLVLASRHGLVVREVGVRMEQRSNGKSSIAGVRSAYYMARVVTVLLVDSIGRKERQ